MRSTPGHLLEGDVTVFIEKCKAFYRLESTLSVMPYLDILRLYFMELYFLQRTYVNTGSHIVVSVCILIHVCEFTFPWCLELVKKPREKSSV